MCTTNYDLSSHEILNEKSFKQLWDVDQLAKFLNLPKTKIYAMTRKHGEGSIPRFKLGRYLRFNKSEIIAWLKEQRKIENTCN